MFACRCYEEQELSRDEKNLHYRFKVDGTRHKLVIQEATLDDMGMYHAFTTGGHTKGELIVEGRYFLFVYLSVCLPVHITPK